MQSCLGSVPRLLLELPQRCSCGILAWIQQTGWQLDGVRPHLCGQTHHLSQLSVHAGPQDERTGGRN